MDYAPGSFADSTATTARTISSSITAIITINGVFQEHIIGKESHEPKIAAGMAIGQYPIESLDYVIPVFTGGMPTNPVPAQVEQAKTDATHANLFVATSIPMSIPYSSQEGKLSLLQDQITN